MTESLRIQADAYDQMVAHCLDAYPLEGCGLLAGRAGADSVTKIFPTRNDAASARVYTVNPLDHLRADEAAQDEGLEIVGVFHSHTHTHAYPSPTDIASAPDPAWLYVLVTFETNAPSTRGFRIIEGDVTELVVDIAQA